MNTIIHQMLFSSASQLPFETDQSDRGKEILESMGFSHAMSTVLPPLVVSTGVQCVNMPLVRATILLQNPESSIPNIRESLRQIYSSHGLGGLWHGTSAGILKTVPKYCTAIFVKVRYVFAFIFGISCKVI